MQAVAAFIEDWEKHPRLGLTAEGLHAIIEQWPDIADYDEDSDGFLAINNCLNEVCNGFEVPRSEWSLWFDCSIDEVRATYQAWLMLRGTSGGVR